MNDRKKGENINDQDLIEENYKKTTALASEEILELMKDSEIKDAKSWASALLKVLVEFYRQNEFSYDDFKKSMLEAFEFYKYKWEEDD